MSADGHKSIRWEQSVRRRTTLPPLIAPEVKLIRNTRNQKSSTEGLQLSLTQRSNAPRETKCGLPQDQDGEEADTTVARRLRRCTPWLELDANENNLFLECNLPSDFVRRQLRSSSEHIVGLMSRGSANASVARSTAMDIMSDVTTQPSLLYSSIFSTLVIERLLRGDTSPTPIESAIGAAAISYLRRVVQNPHDAITDATIVSVIGLAYSGRLAPVREGTRFPRQSFLRELQYIHIYCKLDVVTEHAMGLLRIIELLGGIERVKTPGLTAILSFTGVIGSCRSLTRPPFPFIPITGFTPKAGRLGVTDDEYAAVSSDLGRLGSGFRLALGSVLSDELCNLWSAIQHACDFTVVVENFACGRWTGRTMPEIMDLRNFVQHSIMSLTPSLELYHKGIIVTDVQYESNRLATVLYSFFVIFPMPPVQGFFETLTRQLMENLQTIKADTLARPRLELHLWNLAMGAIGSIGLPNRHWYLSRIKELLPKIKIHDWEELQKLLESFLWHPRTNGADGLDIWEDLSQVDVKEDEEASWVHNILSCPRGDG